jgi:hypothetical protein
MRTLRQTKKEKKKIWSGTPSAYVSGKQILRVILASFDGQLLRSDGFDGVLWSSGLGIIPRRRTIWSIFMLSKIMFYPSIYTMYAFQWWFLRQRKRRLTKITLLIILVFRTTPMLIYYIFLLESPHTLMGMIILFEVIKCIGIYFLFILTLGECPCVATEPYNNTKTYVHMCYR